ncbi:MAG: hypothetical protein HGA49_04280 [Eubacteriaceae bacterium]|nr:hypothetical protein [Eubacteriaceae bacterium]
MQLSFYLIVLSPYLAILPVIGMFYKIFKEKMTVSLDPLNAGVFLLFVWALISGVINRDIMSTLSSFVILLYLSINIYFQTYYNNEIKINKLIMSIWKISLISGVIGIMEKAASYFIDMTWVANYFWSPTYKPSAENYRIYSTFGNPNIAGEWFALMVLVSIYLFEKAKSGTKKYYLAAMLLFSAALIFTGSRGAVVGLEMAILVYALFSKNKKTRIVLISIFLGVLAIALLSPEINHTDSARNKWWILCLALFTEKPVFGWGMFGILEQTGNIHAHNIWLSLAATLGIGGVLVFTWIQTYLFRGLKRLYDEGSMVVPLLAAVQGLILTHGLVDFVMMAPQGGIMYLVASAMISSLTLKYDKYPVLQMKKISQL